MRLYRVFTLFWLTLSLETLQLNAQVQPSDQRQTLKQYVADLQRNPGDLALREKIIKLVLTLSPRPAAPPEADESLGRAKSAFEHAASEEDYVAAAAAYGKASILAPWVPEYYFNQGVALEKAKRLDEAIAAFKWYLVAAPDAQDAKEVRERIGGLKYSAERAANVREGQARKEREERGEQARKEREQAARTAVLDELRTKVEGVNYTASVCNVTDPDKVGRAALAAGRHTFGLDGCNQTEYNGDNWWFDPTGAQHAKFVFPGDGTIQLAQGGYPSLIGTPKGGSAAEIYWECPEREKGKIIGGTAAWVSFSTDLSRLTFSCERPKDDSGFNPGGRYHYTSVSKTK